MHVYIAGPMTGLPEFNFPAFYDAARKLRSIGYQVTNPAEINPDVAMPWEECMKRDVPALLKCDAIVCLPDWHKSRGARLEVYIASSLGLKIIPLELVRMDA